jgi:hypothetical protein
MPDRKNPFITVIYPIFDVRGRASDRIRIWTHGQTLERDRYRVVVASADPALQSDVAALLGPDDKLVSGQAQSDGALWNVGAEHAETPWLVFVEGHALARPDCLAAVARWIQHNPSAEAGNFSVDHDNSYLLARLSERWFHVVHDHWNAPGEWRRLHRAGCAIRADLFRGIGGFEPQYGQFAFQLLAARLYERGVRATLIPDAAVLHQDDSCMRDHRLATIDFVRGDLDARECNNTAFCERYFGFYHARWNRLRRDPKIAFAMVRAVVAAARAHPKRSIGLLRVLWFLLAGLVEGSAPRMAARRLSIALDEFAIEHLPIPEQWSYTRFVRSHRQIVRLAEANWIRTGSKPPAMPHAWQHCDMAQLTPDTIVGIHGLEEHCGRTFRWTEPVFLLRVALSAGENSLQIDTGSIRGDPFSYLLAVVIDGRVLPRTQLQSANGMLTISLTKESTAAARDGLIIVCSPLVPARAGSPDRRIIAMPIQSIQITSAATQSQARKAAG